MIILDPDDPFLRLVMLTDATWYHHKKRVTWLQYVVAWWSRVLPMYRRQHQVTWASLCVFLWYGFLERDADGC